ncbi:uncharacterized protein [Palaemon carinicauda]|uniref:uncharacterized protein n=1 Tax=Palaemon carinicauda TaxID=392227 RepID=UPI0035B599B0
MYHNVLNRVRSSAGETEGFEVRVGLHQGSALRPFIFNIMIDILIEDVREAVPWNILYADDIVLWAENMEDLEMRLERCRQVLEDREMRIIRTKTEYMCTNSEGDDREKYSA